MAPLRLPAMCVLCTGVGKTLSRHSKQRPPLLAASIASHSLTPQSPTTVYIHLLLLQLEFLCCSHLQALQNVTRKTATCVPIRCLPHLWLHCQIVGTFAYQGTIQRTSWVLAFATFHSLQYINYHRAMQLTGHCFLWGSLSGFIFGKMALNMNWMSSGQEFSSSHFRKLFWHSNLQESCDDLIFRSQEDTGQTTLRSLNYCIMQRRTSKKPGCNVRVSSDPWVHLFGSFADYA